MYNTPSQSVALASSLVEKLTGVEHKVMIAPSFTSLTVVSEVLKGSNIILGAQNIAAAEEGAHTGETSVLMLREIGVEVVIIGHSERRHLYGESDGVINSKLKLALSNGLESILCVGEKLEERESGEAESVVQRQLEVGLTGVTPEELKRVTLAYEPVWAIGTGRTATPEDVGMIHRHIRQLLNRLYPDGVADGVVIQYGGSVKPGNVKTLMDVDEVDGVLVGGASLSVDSFVPIAMYDR